MIRGLLTDDEWAYFEPFLIRRAGRPPRNHRRVMDATFWLMRTGAPWRDPAGGVRQLEFDFSAIPPLG